jgi:hypothetical protein
MSVLANVKSKCHRKPIRYSSAARPERLSTLLGEISGARALEKSAEVVVAKRPGESPAERRTKEPRDKPTVTLGQKARSYLKLSGAARKATSVCSPDRKLAVDPAGLRTGRWQAPDLEESGTRRR